MSPRNIILSVLILSVIALGLWFYFHPTVGQAPSPSATSTKTETFDHTISNGTITFGYPAQEFGLAVKPEQILVHSYIPPCDSNFDYCLYYKGTEYQGTNFESAGLRIKRRADLATQIQCLQTLPTGYTGIIPAISTSTDYAVSVFSLSDAATGHYATGKLYRLSFKDSCHEFETRVGMSQFMNYPSGTIKEFTSADQTAVEMKLKNILNGISLPNKEKISF